jgi:hypothetical protein
VWHAPGAIRGKQGRFRRAVTEQRRRLSRMRRFVNVVIVRPGQQIFPPS